VTGLHFQPFHAANGLAVGETGGDLLAGRQLGGVANDAAVGTGVMAAS
jgi:hypothetical protein